MWTWYVLLKTVTAKANELSVIANTLARPEVRNTQTSSVLHLQRRALHEREIIGYNSVQLLIIWVAKPVALS